MRAEGQRVVVLGASVKPARYSNQAIRLLLEKGHQVIPVHPVLNEVCGLPVAASLDAVAPPVDTLTMYVGPQVSTPLAGAILRLRPGRVIFNPGSENPELETVLRAAAIPWEHACTLVLLRTGQFAF